MEKTNFIQMVITEIRAKHLNRDQIYALQQKRLNLLVKHARQHSPLFNDLYQALPEYPDLSLLPPTQKRMLMSDFDRWVTDPEITLERVDSFLQNKSNIGRTLADRCRVSLTSGSTGIPCKVLNDKDTIALSMCLYFVRTFGVFDLIRLGFKWGKLMIISNLAFSMIYNSMMAQVHLSGLNRYRCAAIEVDSPPAAIIAKINQFKPAILYTYPSMMQTLLPEIKRGAIKLPPQLMILGGERCSDGLLKNLRSYLKTHIVNSYGCSECSLIAYSCKEGHLHIYADWVIVEPVDQNNQPVPPGVLSDKILVTNLSNYTQPFIRYEVDDRVIYHTEPCVCGNPLPYMEVEGRIDDNIVLQGNSGEITLSPMTLASPSERDGILKYQLVHFGPNQLEIRLVVDDGYQREKIFQNIVDELQAAFKKLGLPDVSIVLSDEIPKRHPISGKFKMVEHRFSQ